MPFVARIELSDSLDVDCLRASFARKGRLLIGQVLRQDCATALREYLESDTEWGISLAPNARGRRFASAVTYRGFNRSQMRDVFDIAYSDGGAQYAHLYETFSLSNYRNGSSRAGQYYAQFCEFVRSEPFLRFVRQITGLESVRTSTMVACRYRAGHFYASHVDATGGDGHRASYILNLSDYWDAQWGGLLRFKREDGHIDEAYLPRFNSMSIFLSSLEHAVGIVAPYAQHARYSIAGDLLE
jgi:SM-20-related protein